jgi:hypothetical protein
VDGLGVGDVTDGHEDRGVVETFRVCGSMEEGLRNLSTVAR